MSIANNAQLIVQTQKPGGDLECVGFAGLPIATPALIVIYVLGGQEVSRDLLRLKNGLLHEILSWSPQAHQITLPCKGRIDSSLECHATGEPTCSKLLVLVGDAQQPWSMSSEMQHWVDGDATYRILPLLPNVARTSAAKILPPALKHLNAEFWTISITEALPSILALAGLTPSSRRIFLSYRQTETSILAIQLFDALAHANFEVFLDHFRINPGVNFQEKLTHELGDKSVLLIIESANYLASPWTLYELNIAKACGLGIIALQLPGAPKSPGIDDALRRKLHTSDLEAGTAGASVQLRDDPLREVIDYVALEHDRAMIARAQMLRDSFEGALLREGTQGHTIEGDGSFRVISQSGKRYSVWLASRPPELADFHSAHGLASPPVEGVVIGLSRLMEPSRAPQVEWLSRLSGLKLVDEGQLKWAATQIAKGTM